MNLLALHGIARDRDGLAPELLAVMSRQAAIAADPKIVPLRSADPMMPDVAGDLRPAVPGTSRGIRPLEPLIASRRRRISQAP